VLTRYPIAMSVLGVAILVASFRLFRLYGLITSGGRAPGRTGHWLHRAEAETTEVIGQRRLLRWTVPGLAHAFTFWGFIVLIFTIVEAIGDLFDRRFAIPGIGHAAALGFFEDAFAVAVLIALVTFTIIRLRESPHRLDRRSRFYGSHTRAAWITLGMIFLVIATLLLYRAAQTNTGDFPYGWWAFASRGIGRALHPLGVGTNRALETTFVDLNVSVIAAFLVFVVYSKHLHIVLAPINVAFSRKPRALGALDTTPDLDPDKITDETTFGAGRIAEFSWKQLLDFATCTECGRCQSQCPAWATGKPLSPKLVVMDLRDELLRSPSTARNEGDGSAELVPRVIEPDVLWSCTTCGACVEQCPVDIEHVDAILDLRRHEVLMESRFPSEAGTMLRNVERSGDPWGLGSQHRLDWTEGLGFAVAVVTDEVPDDVEYLFWVGCAGAFDDRARSTTQAIARLLRRAGISFAVLGPAESCTGDPARRLGNEYLFQEQAKANIERLSQVKAHKVLASCPHCFNTIANEYPALGGDFEVVHHAQVLDELVGAGRLAPQALDQTVTYHDPCYLGRHNRVFDEPRTVVRATSTKEPIEMHRCRERGFCCGAGGARMWLEESIGTRINLDRTDEALSTGADVVSTACPYCKIMIDDAVRARGREQEVRVVDIAQLLDDTTSGEEPIAALSD
jgi:Fe-S oxidoreductase/TM2 domain-containing membrane protein YozV